MSENITEIQKAETQKNVLQKFITWTSLNRIWRAKFITRTTILLFIVSFCMTIFGDIIIKWLIHDPYVLRWLPVIFFIWLMCFYLYWNIYLNNKRFHDCWQSWWWQLLQLIPVVNFIVIIYLCVVPWESGINKYGESSETETREEFLAWICPVIICLGVMVVFKCFNNL